MLLVARFTLPSNSPIVLVAQLTVVGSKIPNQQPSRPDASAAVRGAQPIPSHLSLDLQQPLLTNAQQTQQHIRTSSSVPLQPALKDRICSQPASAQPAHLRQLAPANNKASNTWRTLSHGHVDGTG